MVELFICHWGWEPNLFFTFLLFQSCFVRLIREFNSGQQVQNVVDYSELLPFLVLEVNSLEFFKGQVHLRIILLLEI